MKKYLFGLSLLLLVGGGCTSSLAVQGDANDAWEAAFPSGKWQFANTDTYRLPVDFSYTLEQEGDMVRIQNFVGSDNPRAVYPDEAFFIEIRTSASTDVENFSNEHGQVEEVTLAGETVLNGTDRAQGGESWPGHSYYHADRDVVIYLSYRKSKGGELAEAVIQQIKWQ